MNTIRRNSSRIFRVSKTEKAGLTFSVGRVRRLLRKGRYAKRIRIGSAVYLATVLEYLVAEILEIAGNEAVLNKRKRIIPRHIMLGVRKDEELNVLFKDVTISNSGVLPHVHTCLINPKKM